MTDVIDAEKGGEGSAESEKVNKNGNYCNLGAVGGQLGGPATLLASAVSNVGRYREIIFSGGPFF